MLSKTIMDSLRIRMYENALRFSGSSMFSRENYYRGLINDAWEMVLSEIWNEEQCPEPAQAGELVIVLKNMGLVKGETAVPDHDEYEIRMENWEYTVHQGFLGVSIHPTCEYYPLDSVKKMVAGFTPKTGKPYFFLAKILSSFDRSVPDILNAAREEEYRAMQSIKRHMIRTSAVKSRLECLEGEYDSLKFECIGDETKCVVVTDEEVSVVTVISDENIQERLDTIADEVHDILLNPFTRTRKYGEKYSLVRD